jgi:cAMP phosphodiesterase
MEKDDDVLTSVLTTIANENDYVVTFGDTEVDKNKNDDVQKIVRRKTMNFAGKK